MAISVLGEAALANRKKSLYKTVFRQMYTLYYLLFKSGIACYHLVQDLVSYSLLSKNTKINIYRTIILYVVL
jgi:hypothetical protein